MNIPSGFQKLLNDVDPRDMNKMPAAEVIKAFSLLKDAMEILFKTYDIAGELGWYLIDNKGSLESSKEIQDLGKLTDNIRIISIRYSNWE